MSGEIKAIVAPFLEAMKKAELTVTKPMIQAVIENGGKFALEQNRVRYQGGFYRKWIPRYGVTHWTQLADTSHFLPSVWEYHGQKDCKAGRGCLSENSYYLAGYAREYELGEMQDALTRDVTII